MYFHNFEQLWPINHFPDNTINMASAQLIKKHSDTYFSTEKLLMQVLYQLLRLCIFFSLFLLHIISKTISLVDQKISSLYLYFINIETSRSSNSYRDYSLFVERKVSLLFSLWPREESSRTRLSTSVLLWL